MSEDYGFFANKLTDRTYVSKPFGDYDSSGDLRELRFASKVFDVSELHQFIQIKDEIILRVTAGEREEIKATFYDDSREIKALTIQRYTRKSGKPHQISFTFFGEEIPKLIQFIRTIKYLYLEDDQSTKVDDEILEDLLLTSEDKRKFFLDNLDLVAEITQSEISRRDVVALAYRKKQLEIFEQLLNDDRFFEFTRDNWSKRGKEAVWQQFFENNPWIFGYGLSFIFTSPLDGRAIEQVVSGTRINESGKRVEALMKTRGLVSSLCFVEIKTHETRLLDHRKAYRSESWRISNELSGSVAQIQKTVQKAIRDIGTRIEIHDNIGNPTGELAFLYQPKSYVVIGSLDEFRTDHGINENKFCSFELFRQNLTNPEIITFDELLERAKFIVQNSEQPIVEVELGHEGLNTEGSFSSYDDELTDFNEEDIPF